MIQDSREFEPSPLRARRNELSEAIKSGLEILSNVYKLEASAEETPDMSKYMNMPAERVTSARVGSSEEVDFAEVARSLAKPSEEQLRDFPEAA